MLITPKCIVTYSDRRENIFMSSYSYEERKGIKPISWDYFNQLCKDLCVEISRFNPDIVLAIARGGLYPGTLISHILQKELYPIRITRRVNDLIKYKTPVWLIKPPKIIKDKKILIVDEVCDSGETLEIVTKSAKDLGASEIKTAVLYSHTKGKNIPDYIGVVTDELVINPWDKEILKDGKFIHHPEYTEALNQQGK